MSEDWRPEWIERERDTARLVTACWNAIGGDPSPKQLEGLTRLTWITKSPSAEEDWMVVVDHVSARTTTWRGLEQIFGVRLPPSRDELFSSLELEHAGLPRDVAYAASVPVGFSHFYRAFRGKRLTEWFEANHETVARLLQDARMWGEDNALRLEAARIIEALPKLMRGEKGSDGIRAGNFLTPLLTFLDPENRFPIVNARHPEVMSVLGLSSASFARQVDALLALVPWEEAGIKDAMDLDWWAGWEDAQWTANAVSRVQKPAVIRRRRSP